MTTWILRGSITMLCTGGLVLLPGCHSGGDGDGIRPIRASVATPNPAPAGPAVFLRVAASDDPSDDVVPVEVVLVAGGAPLAFDAYNVEILPTDPNNPGVLRDGVQQMNFDPATGTTPFGTCNSCLSNGGLCGLCVPCGSCAPGTLTSSVNTPFCASDCCSDNNSFTLNVNSVTASGCLPVTVAANGQVILATVSVVARVAGSSRLNFRIDPNATGDCEILLQGAEQAVTFDDRGAVFTSMR